ncbi:uncharacterized protein LOC118765973 [Octopus sinensis]|uniref:Uncharacterized protein LOC118761790 n=1 Tax=Octopus sinensis TaxID=2607531 RepID=A0A7E6ELJ6_9MOLL|nr:uncharacterized protein LOC118761790 [Octopus sinensis]XP_036364804.1 uncharacterized protein LOC118765973 [Octopus sinensis]
MKSAKKYIATDLNSIILENVEFYTIDNTDYFELKKSFAEDVGPLQMNFSSHLYRQFMKKMTSQTTTVTDRKEEGETTPSLPLKQAKIHVEIMAEKDFENVQRMCPETPLDGNQLEVERIEEINSVQVKNVSSNVSSEILKSYFGDRERSSGGEISSVQKQTSDTYIVSFKEAYGR